MLRALGRSGTTGRLNPCGHWPIAGASTPLRSAKLTAEETSRQPAIGGVKVTRANQPATRVACGCRMRTTVLISLLSQWTASISAPISITTGREAYAPYHHSQASLQWLHSLLHSVSLLLCFLLPSCLSACPQGWMDRRASHLLDAPVSQRQGYKRGTGLQLHARRLRCNAGHTCSSSRNWKPVTLPIGRPGGCGLSPGVHDPEIAILINGLLNMASGSMMADQDTVVPLRSTTPHGLPGDAPQGR